MQFEIYLHGRERASERARSGNVKWTHRDLSQYNQQHKRAKQTNTQIHRENIKLRQMWMPFPHLSQRNFKFSYPFLNAIRIPASALVHTINSCAHNTYRGCCCCYCYCCGLFLCLLICICYLSKIEINVCLWLCARVCSVYVLCTAHK